MGEAPGEEHLLLRRARDDGPPKGGLLSDHVPHHGDLLPLLCFRVSILLLRHKAPTPDPDLASPIMGCR